MVREIMPRIIPEVNTLFPSWLAGGSGIGLAYLLFFSNVHVLSVFIYQKNTIRENGLFSCVAVILTNSFASNSGTRNFEFLV